MTKEEREEAIYQLERCIHNAKVSGNKYSHFELAIEALKVEPCEDAISRQAVLDLCDSKDSEYKVIHFKEDVECLPPVHSQPNKEDIHREREQAYMCGYEDGSRKYRAEQSENAISRQAVIKTLDDMDNVLDEDRTIENYKELLKECYEVLPPVNPQGSTEQFAKWVATEIFDENWEYNKDAFAELACRKLAKLGIVRANGDEWESVEPQERSDKE